MVWWMTDALQERKTILRFKQVREPSSPPFRARDLGVSGPRSHRIKLRKVEWCRERSEGIAHPPVMPYRPAFARPLFDKNRALPRMVRPSALPSAPIADNPTELGA